MFADWLCAFSPVIGLACNVVLQVIIFRLLGNRLLKTIFAGFFLGMIPVLAIYAWQVYMGRDVVDAVGLCVSSLLTYGALGMGYFFFVCLGETARRIRLLREFVEAEDNTLSMDGILSRYNAAEIVSVRLGRLLGNGQIVEKDGRYFIGKPTVLTMSRIIVALKWLVLGKTSEFDK